MNYRRAKGHRPSPRRSANEELKQLAERYPWFDAAQRASSGDDLPPHLQLMKTVHLGIGANPYRITENKPDAENRSQKDRFKKQKHRKPAPQEEAALEASKPSAKPDTEVKQETQPKETPKPREKQGPRELRTDVQQPAQKPQQPKEQPKEEAPAAKQQPKAKPAPQKQQQQQQPKPAQKANDKVEKKAPVANKPKVAEQNIKKTNNAEDVRKTKPTKPAKSADTIDIIDEFIDKGDHKVVPRDTTPEYINSGNQDLPVDDELITEELAQVYLDQELFPQAIAIYERLSLLYPKKSIYFAEIIEEAKLRAAEEEE